MSEIDKHEERALRLMRELRALPPPGIPIPERYPQEDRLAKQAKRDWAILQRGPDKAYWGNG